VHSTVIGRAIRVGEPASDVHDQTDSAGVSATIEQLYRAESGRILATLVRLLGDVDLAEEATQDAFLAATEAWPRTGVPANPRPWLVSAGRFRAIDRLRRRARFDAALARLAATIDDETDREPEAQTVDDDRLRLIFTCCHPALTPDAQIAMTLREVCGLTTEMIARAFLVSAPTVAQRIVRAKARIRAEQIPYEVPDRESLAERLEPVLRVIYLLFTQGYKPGFGRELSRRELADEAIRLGRELADLLPEAEVLGLLALMLLHESRALARTDDENDLVLLGDQDRSMWNRDQVREGLALSRRAMAAEALGTYAIQSAIAAEHMRSADAADTDWRRIASLYDLLAVADPSPIVELNRAVAIGERDGALAGLAAIDAVFARADFAPDHLAHAARADFLRRLTRVSDARAAYQRALALAETHPERRFLERRLRELDYND
jgi:RNA polymerase sigma-70 factor, ECF subfamily